MPSLSTTGNHESHLPAAILVCRRGILRYQFAVKIDLDALLVLGKTTAFHGDRGSHRTCLRANRQAWLHPEELISVDSTVILIGAHLMVSLVTFGDGEGDREISVVIGPDFGYIGVVSGIQIIVNIDPLIGSKIVAIDGHLFSRDPLAGGKVDISSVSGLRRCSRQDHS